LVCKRQSSIHLIIVVAGIFLFKRTEFRSPINRVFESKCMNTERKDTTRSYPTPLNNSLKRTGRPGDFGLLLPKSRLPGWWLV